MTGNVTDFQRDLLAWYDRHRRDLPWRVAAGSPLAPDPYHVLVSEAMLQQTQVATVVPYYRRFLERFPTAAALAAAEEQAVLRAWQGLGYYSRARNLQRAAQRIMTDHGGQVPATVAALLSLPGVGRYTAGAVASIAFGVAAPILDGNVARVLCRVDAVRDDPRDAAVRDLLWSRAEAVLPDDRLGDFNSALMELGATVCTPRSPRCLMCPVRGQCDAVALGIQEQIPPPKKAGPTPLERRWTFAIRNGDRCLIEQRPARGRWAGLWQFVTVPAGPRGPTPRTIGDRLSLRVTPPEPLGRVDHALTHRRYQFDVFRCDVEGSVPDPGPRRWVTAADLSAYPLPRPHLRVAALVGWATPP